MTSAVLKLEEFSEYKDGWDSYSGKPIKPGVISRAKALLWSLGDGWTPRPVADGSITLEYRQELTGVSVVGEISIGSE